MRERTLLSILGGCAAVAVAPVVPWLLSLIFDSMSDGWLGGLAVTVPVALGAAALTFAAHGLMLHRDLVESLEEDFAATIGERVAAPLEEAALVGAGVGATSVPAPTEPVTAPSGTGAAPPPDEGGGPAADVGDKAKQAIRKVGKQAAGRTASRSKGRAKSSLRGMLRGLDPRH